MPVILEDYQLRVVDALSSLYRDAVKGVKNAPKAAILKAPTASGKTVMLARALSDISGSGTPTVWFWLAPFDNIIGQTEKTIRSEAGESLTPKQLRDRTYGGHRSGDVWLSTAALASSSKAGPAEDTEFSPSLRSMAKEIRSSGMRVGVVIDEAHLNAKQKGKFVEAITLLKPDVIFAASATPNDEALEKFFSALKIRAAVTVSVDRSEAVERHLNKEGLWARLVSAAGAGEQAKLDLLVRAAWQRNAQIQQALTEADLNIVPLALFQADNKAEGQRMLESVRRVTGLSEKEVAFYDSESKAKSQKTLNEIADDQEVKALVFKVAAGTGFDAPRSFCLASARTVRDETSAAQFIGRTMRVPRALRSFLFANPEHPSRDILNNAHLFLLDDEAQTGFRAAVSKITGSFAAAGLSRISVKRTDKDGNDAIDEDADNFVYEEILTRCGPDGEGFKSMDDFEDALGDIGVEVKYPRSAAFDEPLPREEWRRNAELADFSVLERLRGSVVTPQRVRDRLRRAEGVFTVTEAGDDLNTEVDEDEQSVSRWQAVRAAKADFTDSFMRSVSLIPGLAEKGMARGLLCQMTDEVIATGLVRHEDMKLASRVAMIIANEFHAEMKTAVTKGDGAGRVIRSAGPIPDGYLVFGQTKTYSRMSHGYYVEKGAYVEPPAGIMALMRDVSRMGVMIAGEIKHFSASDINAVLNGIEQDFVKWTRAEDRIISVFRNPQGKPYACAYANIGGQNQMFYPDFVVAKDDGTREAFETKYDRKDLREKMAGRNEADASLRVRFVVRNEVSGVLEEVTGYDESGQELRRTLVIGK